MNPLFLTGIILAMPVIAWVPARFWTLCGAPWCLNIYPEWLDRYIYSKALPYLHPDMNAAAEQMEFLETWIVTTIILEIVSLLLIFLLKDTFRDGL